MTIQVEFTGPMRRPWPERSRALEVGEGMLLAELLRSFGYSEDEAKVLSCSINGATVRLRAPLHDGDRVLVTLLLGGG